MFNVVKGILYRMINNKAFLIMPLVITPIIIASAIYFSSSIIAKPSIATTSAFNINFNNQVNIIKVKNKPLLSELVRNKYDAFIYYNNGKLIIDTVKGKDFKDKIENMIKGEKNAFQDGEKRGVASNIVGFITMFLLILGVMLYKFFFDDKKGISKRILSANISYRKYLGSHFISVFIMVFIPTSIITLLLKEVLKLNTSVTSLQIIFIIFILSILSSSFGLLISSIVKVSESASMLGVMINVITTLIAGSFFTISDNNIIKFISNILPQRHILDFTLTLENNSVYDYGDLINVILISGIMIFTSLLINRYKMRRYNSL